MFITTAFVSASPLTLQLSSVLVDDNEYSNKNREFWKNSANQAASVEREMLRVVGLWVLNRTGKESDES